MKIIIPIILMFMLMACGGSSIVCPNSIYSPTLSNTIVLTGPKLTLKVRNSYCCHDISIDVQQPCSTKPNPNPIGPLQPYGMILKPGHNEIISGFPYICLTQGIKIWVAANENMYPEYCAVDIGLSNKRYIFKLDMVKGVQTNCFVTRTGKDSAIFNYNFNQIGERN